MRFRLKLNHRGVLDNMKTKIVFFSQSGNIELIVKHIGERLNSDVTELVPIKEYPSTGFAKYFHGGRGVVFKDRPALKTYDKSLNYDLIILASPVWAGSFVPPMRTFLTENSLSGKNVAFVVSSKSGDESRSFKEFEKLQPSAKLAGTLSLREPKTNDTDNQVNKTIKWVQSLL